jgi:hypothetical protein
MAASPTDIVWWKDENGNFQQAQRAAVENAGKQWTEVKKGFPVNAAEDEPAEQAPIDTTTGA